MKKLLILLSIYLIPAYTLVSQDIVVFRTGEEKEAIVKKVGITIIEYVRYDNKEGAVYEVLKDDVFMIQYENGVKDYFKTPTNVPPGDKKIKEGLFMDTRDSTNYKFVKIGNQTWMSENLRYDDGKSPYSPNNTASCDDCGRYYIYDDAIKACPAGWHLPTDNEWMDLEMEVGMLESDAIKYGWRGTPPGQASQLLKKSNPGFDLRMCGYLTQGSYSKKNPWYNNNLKNEEGFYWSSTPYQDYKSAMTIRHLKGRASIERCDERKKSHLPVRCLKDN